MLGLGLIADKLAEVRARSRLARHEAELQEAVLDQLTLWGDRVVDDDEGVVVGSDAYLRTFGQRMTAGSEYTPSLHALNRARRVARHMYATNPFARNIVRQVVNHVVGRGFRVKFEDQAAADEWRERAKEIDWARRRREIPKRVMRDGEGIAQKFDGGAVRFVEPEHVEPTPEHSSSHPLGVVTDDDDVETAVEYDIRGQGSVPAEDVFHFKPPDTDMDELRGWPPLFDLKPWIDDYINFVRDRGLLNRWRASVLAIRKKKGATGAELRGIQDRVRQGTLRKLGGQTSPVELFRNRGRIIDTNDDVDYEFKAPNVGAQDAAEDGRACRLLIAVMCSFPEYLVTSDAANANFASTAVAESPGVRAMEAYQDHFGTDFARFIEWVLGRPLEVDIIFPAVSMRKELEQTQARAVRFQNGVLSKETWIEMDSLDPQRELEKIANYE